MTIPKAFITLGALALAACGDGTGTSGSGVDVEVVSVERIMYLGDTPAFVFTLENRGAAMVEHVTVDVDAVRSGTTVGHAATEAPDLSPGERAVTEPALLLQVASHSDYHCYRYRVRSYDGRGQELSDHSYSEVCT